MDKTPPPVADDDEESDERSVGPSIRDMRKWGLTYHGGGHVPGVPAMSMDGPEAARTVPTRAALLGLLDTGWYTVNSDPDAPPAPTRPRKHPHHPDLPPTVHPVTPAPSVPVTPPEGPEQP